MPQTARRIDIEDTELGAAPLVAVPDHDDPIAGDEQLIVPGGARVDARSERVHRGDRFQVVPTDGDREQATAAQDDQVIAVELHDAALVHARVLRVGDRVLGPVRERGVGDDPGDRHCLELHHDGAERDIHLQGVRRSQLE